MGLEAKQQQVLCCTPRGRAVVKGKPAIGKASASECLGTLSAGSRC